MSGALDGIRVLDLTRLFPGNHWTWLLSTFGADVIKVQDAGAGDYMRDLGEQVDGSRPELPRLQRSASLTDR